MPRPKKPIKDSFNREMIHTTPSGDTFRVTEDKTNKKFYVYKNKERLFSRKKKSDIETEFYRLIKNENGIQTLSTPRNLDIENINNYDDLENKLINGKEFKLVFDESGQTTVQDISHISDEEIITKFMELLKKDKKRVAILSNNKKIAELLDDDIYTKADLQTRIDEILPAYFNRVENSPKRHLRYSAKTRWKELIAIMNKCAGRELVYINNIKPDYIKTYGNEIYKASTDRKYTNAYWMSEKTKIALKKNDIYPRWKWHRERLDILKHLFQNYIDENMLNIKLPAKEKLIKEKIELLNSIKIIKKVKALTRKIRKDDFHTLILKATFEMKLWMYIAIQACFTLKDISDLRESDFDDLEKGFIYKHREKEGIQRFAKLNQTTIEMLKIYMKENPTNNDYIFTYRKGISKSQNIKPKQMREYFKALKKLVKNDLVDKDIEFRHIKKAGVSTAVYVLNNLQLNFLQGHSCKIEDAYIQREMEHVSKGCEYIAQEYNLGE